MCKYKNKNLWKGINVWISDHFIARVIVYFIFKIVIKVPKFTLDLPIVLNVPYLANLKTVIGMFLPIT